MNRDLGGLLATSVMTFSRAYPFSPRSLEYCSEIDCKLSASRSHGSYCRFAIGSGLLMHRTASVAGTSNSSGNSHFRQGARNDWNLFLSCLKLSFFTSKLDKQHSRMRNSPGEVCPRCGDEPLGPDPEGSNRCRCEGDVAARRDIDRIRPKNRLRARRRQPIFSSHTPNRTRSQLGVESRRSALAVARGSSSWPVAFACYRRLSLAHSHVSSAHSSNRACGIPLRCFFVGKLNRRNSSMKLHREIGVSEKTVWFLV